MSSKRNSAKEKAHEQAIIWYKVFRRISALEDLAEPKQLGKICHVIAISADIIYSNASYINFRFHRGLRIISMN